MKNFYHPIIINIILINIIFSSNISIKPIDLLSSLHNNADWKLLQSKENISVSTKKIEGKDLLGVMVKGEISLPNEILQNVIMDIDGYSDFLKGSSSIISKKLKKTSDFVDGYQFIPINIPFFENREYLFRMYPRSYRNDDNTSIIHWHLLDRDLQYLNSDSLTATYLNYGAGLWVAEKSTENKTYISYRIYMDPGGSLPSFLIDMINKTSVVNIFNDVVAEAQKRFDINR